MNDILNALNGFSDQVDPRTKDWFLMRNPWPVGLLAYIYFEFVTNWGPKWMENQPAFRLESVIQIYNFLQIIFNTNLFYQGFHLWTEYSWQCEPVDYSSTPKAIRVAELVHLYFLDRIADLMCTVFFVLRKKQSHVTFAHVHHHISMMIGSWIVVRFFAGGQVMFTGGVTTLVNIFWYTHCLVASLKIWKPWWKKYLIQMIVLQYLASIYHFFQLWWVKDCGFPKYLGLFFVPQSLCMLYLFSRLDFQSLFGKLNSNLSTM